MLASGGGGWAEKYPVDKAVVSTEQGSEEPAGSWRLPVGGDPGQASKQG